jgi:hypothetical protein
MLPRGASEKLIRLMWKISSAVIPQILLTEINGMEPDQSLRESAIPAEDNRNLLPQPRELEVGLPHLLEVNSVIGMDQHITQTGHSPPRNLGMAGSAVGTQAFGGFTHHFKATQQSILQVVRMSERLKVGNRETKALSMLKRISSRA